MIPRDELALALYENGVISVTCDKPQGFPLIFDFEKLSKELARDVAQHMMHEVRKSIPGEIRAVFCIPEFGGELLQKAFGEHHGLDLPPLLDSNQKPITINHTSTVSTLLVSGCFLDPNILDRVQYTLTVNGSRIVRRATLIAFPGYNIRRNLQYLSHLWNACQFLRELQQAGKITIDTLRDAENNLERFTSRRAPA